MTGAAGAAAAGCTAAAATVRRWLGHRASSGAALPHWAISTDAPPSGVGATSPLLAGRCRCNKASATCEGSSSNIRLLIVFTAI